MQQDEGVEHISPCGAGVVYPRGTTARSGSRAAPGQGLLPSLPGSTN